MIKLDTEGLRGIRSSYHEVIISASTRRCLRSSAGSRISKQNINEQTYHCRHQTTPAIAGLRWGERLWNIVWEGQGLVSCSAPHAIWLTIIYELRQFYKHSYLWTLRGWVYFKRCPYETETVPRLQLFIRQAVRTRQKSFSSYTGREERFIQTA